MQTAILVAGGFALLALSAFAGRAFGGAHGFAMAAVLFYRFGSLAQQSTCTWESRRQGIPLRRSPRFFFSSSLFPLLAQVSRSFVRPALRTERWRSGTA